MNSKSTTAVVLFAFRREQARGARRGEMGGAKKQGAIARALQNHIFKEGNNEV